MNGINPVTTQITPQKVSFAAKKGGLSQAQQQFLKEAGISDGGGSKVKKVAVGAVLTALVAAAALKFAPAKHFVDGGKLQKLAPLKNKVDGLVKVVVDKATPIIDKVKAKFAKKAPEAAEAAKDAAAKIMA